MKGKAAAQTILYHCLSASCMRSACSPTAAGKFSLQLSCCESEGKTLKELGCVVTHCVSSLSAGF